MNGTSFTHAAYVAFVVLEALCLAYALLCAYSVIRTTLAIRELPGEVPAPAVWPKLSLIVPARNEAQSLEAATLAKLQCRYPNLEVVLVDDRSTDDTGAIADRVAATDARLRVIHLEELPEGWLGKVHALHRGIQASSGEWIVLSDADVHPSPTLFERVVAQAEACGHDFVAIMPHIRPTSFWLDAVFTTLCRFLVASSRGWAVSDPKSSAFAGSGVFVLFRRAVYDRTKGLEWLKLEVADDVGFGQMMKRSGARCALYNGPDDLELYFYRSLHEMTHGLEKNGFAVLGRYSIVRHFAIVLPLTWLEVGAVAGLFASDVRVQAVACATVALQAVAQVACAVWTKRPVASALVPFWGSVVLLLIMTRAAVLATVRGAVIWRGTRYSVEQLRASSRLELP